MNRLYLNTIITALFFGCYVVTVGPNVDCDMLSFKMDLTIF